MPLAPEQGRVESESDQRRRQGASAVDRALGPRQREGEREAREDHAAELEPGRRFRVGLEPSQPAGGMNAGDGQNHHGHRVQGRHQFQREDSCADHPGEEGERQQPKRQIRRLAPLFELTFLKGRREPDLRPQEQERRHHEHGEQRGRRPRDARRGQRVEGAQREQRHRQEPRAARQAQRRRHQTDQQEERRGVEREARHAPGGWLSQQFHLADEHEVGRDDEQGRQQHDPPGAFGPPAHQARAQRREQRRVDQGQHALADRRPQPRPEQLVRADV